MSHETEPRTESSRIPADYVPSVQETAQIPYPERAEKEYKKPGRAKQTGVALGGLGVLLVGGGAFMAANWNDGTSPETTPAPSVEAPVTPGEPAETASPSETETSSLPGPETLPNGEALLTPVELIELREQDGDAAITEYFTPTLDKLGLTAEEANADPAEFGDRFGNLQALYEEALYNLPAAMAGDIIPGEEEAFIDSIGRWAPLTAGSRNSNNFEEVLKYAADIQFASKVIGTEQEIQWDVANQVATTQTSQDNFALEVTSRTTNDSILFEYAGNDYTKMYDNTEILSFTAALNEDGTISITD